MIPAVEEMHRCDTESTGEPGGEVEAALEGEAWKSEHDYNPWSTHCLGLERAFEGRELTSHPRESAR